MKLRNHITPVFCLVVALASLFLGSAAVAQQAFPATPFMPPGRQSLLCDRFYIQAGAQFRNLQRFGFEKQPNVIRYSEPVEDPHNPGVFYTGGRPPFGPNQPGNFGTGTGVPGYQEFGPPTGVFADGPRRSGIWYYNDGHITPNGSTGESPPTPVLWPSIGSTNNYAGLGQYMSDAVSGIDLGIFWVDSTSLQVSNGFDQVYPPNTSQVGFDPLHPPNKTNTFNILWHRVLDDTVAIYPERGVPSRIWRTNGQPIQWDDFNEQIWSPSVEIGFQWTNLFDFFYGISWFDLNRSIARTFTSQADLWRRAYQDTFPFWSDDDNPWAVGSWSSNVRPNGTNVNQQILPDSHGTGGFPRRSFYEQIDVNGTANLPPVTLTEQVICRTDVRVYENRFGARSWTPLFGLGRFGVTLGPLANLIYFRAAQTTRNEFSGGVAHVDTFYSFREAWLVSYGLFAGADIEIDFNNFFFKTNLQYNLSEAKQLENSANVWTNLNLSGYTSVLAAGVRF